MKNTQGPPLLGLESEMLQLLFRNGTPEQWTETLRAPLQHARACGRLDLVAALLRAGADGSDAANAAPCAARPGPSPSVQRSELYIATRAGDGTKAWQLMLQGADVNAWDPIEGMCVLQAAVHGNHEHIANGLLARGADPNTRCIWDRTLLHVAALGGRCGIVKALLANGGDKNAVDDFGETALTKASHLGRRQVADTLMAVGCDVNIRGTGPSRYTALDRAAQNGHVGILKAIIRHGGKVESADERGCTAMHVAAYHGELGAVGALIKAGGSIETKNAFGWTPLVFAASSCSRAVMLDLLKRGAAVNVQSRKGTTPLHQACLGPREGLEAAVKLLLQWGADKALLDAKQRTAADMIDSKLEDDEPRCSPEEADRVRLLLSSSRRPSTDKVWGRRCWLVMLRSRATERVSGDCSNPTGGDESEGAAADGGQQITGNKSPRDESPGSVERRVRVRPSSGEGAAGAASGGEGGGLSNVVWWLAGVDHDDVFRAVVKFL